MIKKVDEYQINDTKTQIVSEPVVAYRVQGETNILNNCTLRDDMKSAIEGEELLNRLRPRLKFLFK